MRAEADQGTGSTATRLSRAALPALPASVERPDYGDEPVTVGIVHFGLGNFHRAHQAVYLHRLLRAGQARDWAITGVGVREGDQRMRDVLAAQDGLYTHLVRHADGTEDATVVGSIQGFRYAPDAPGEVVELLAGPEVRIVSLTITEGGYVADPSDGREPADDPLVREEAASGLTPPRTAFGYIVAGLRERRRRGIAPFAVMSCDNVQGNGHVARMSVEGVARLVDPELADWIAREVAFPSTMVDRVTPATSPADVEHVARLLGVRDEWPVVSEPFTQWIIEDEFPAGRPPFELAGATFVADIESYESIKLRLLNGGHQALAYAGQLLGHRFVHEACADPLVAGFVRAYLSAEALPTIDPPEGFDLPGYIDTGLDRFGNPAVRDTLARLSVDASHRIPKFVLPVIAERLAAGEGAARGAVLIATWLAFCQEAGEGGRFALDDPDGPRLLDAAAAARTDPLEFLRGIPTLAPLAEDAGFAAAFLAASERIAGGDLAGLLADAAA